MKFYNSAFNTDNIYIKSIAWDKLNFYAELASGTYDFTSNYIYK